MFSKILPSSYRNRDKVALTWDSAGLNFNYRIMYPVHTWQFIWHALKFIELTNELSNYLTWDRSFNSKIKLLTLAPPPTQDCCREQTIGCLCECFKNCKVHYYLKVGFVCWLDVIPIIVIFYGYQFITFSIPIKAHS